MREIFGWLVRHERIVAGVCLLLIIALLVQLKFSGRTGEPKTGAAVGLQARRADASAPPSVAGRWEMQVAKRKGGVQIWTLTLEQSGEALKGVIKSEGGDLPVTGTIRGDVLKLSATRFGVTVEFDATADEGRMSGRMKALTVERAWTAKRV